MKPFNLEEAKNGRPVVTRYGYEVEIISFDGRGQYPIFGYVNEENVVKQWTKDGYYLSSSAEDKNALDLFMKEEIVEHEGWIIIAFDSENPYLAYKEIYKNLQSAMYKKHILGSYTEVVKIKFKEKLCK